VTLPSLVDLMTGAKPFEIKLKFSHRAESSRFGLLFEGEYGWAEFAPFSYHPAGHQARWLQAALEMGWGILPEPKSEKVLVNSIVPELPLAQVGTLVKNVGAQTVKVKFASKNVKADIEILERISSVIEKPKFRIDFNQGLTADIVKDYLSAFSDFEIEYLEEPSKDKIIIDKIKDNFALAIDESIRLQSNAIDLTWVNEYGWADYWILKPIPLGGFTRTKQIAEAATKPVVISGSFDSSCGLYLTTLAASWLSELPAGAATGSLLETDVIENPLIAANGEIAVKKVIPEIISAPPEAVIGKLFRQLETAYYELVQLEG
jgi:o-succinylbenzoate synthase